MAEPGIPFRISTSTSYEAASSRVTLTGSFRTSQSAVRLAAPGVSTSHFPELHAGSSRFDPGADMGDLWAAIDTRIMKREPGLVQEAI